jgi:hypothetical protein
VKLGTIALLAIGIVVLRPSLNVPVDGFIDGSPVLRAQFPSPSSPLPVGLSADSFSVQVALLRKFGAGPDSAG